MFWLYDAVVRKKMNFAEQNGDNFQTRFKKSGPHEPVFLAPISSRRKYITQILRLNHDPFSFQRAEDEMRELDPDDPFFFDYYVEPNCRVLRGGSNYLPDSLLEQLRQPGNMIIYGKPKSGKTALRYNLELLCRTVPDGTLVVSVALAKEGTQPSLGNFETELWQQLTQELSIDLFVQSIEQFEQNQSKLVGQTALSLQTLWHDQIDGFSRAVEQSLRSPGRDLSPIWWDRFGRPVVRYTSLTTERRKFLENIQWPLEDMQLSTGKAKFDYAVQLAHRLGYRQIYFLVDQAVDTRHNEITMLKSILMDYAESSEIPVYAKFFLLPEMITDVNRTSRDYQLPAKSFSAIIEWNTERLQKVIANRFRSAGSLRSLDEIFESGLILSLLRFLYTNGYHAPGQYLSWLSRLIDIHVANQPDEHQLTSQDWELLKARWQGEFVAVGERLTYHSDLNVNRVVEHKFFCTDWFLSGKRLLTVTGSPGIGKTWFIHHIRSTFCQDQLPPNYLLTLKPNNASNPINVRFSEDLKEFIESLNKSEAVSVHQYDPIVEMEAMAESVAREVCVDLIDNQEEFFLFIDGSDELNVSEWREFEKKIIEPLARHVCFRFIIALRNDQRIRARNLRLSAEKLELPTLRGRGIEQVDKLRENSLLTKDHTIYLPNDYEWEHPGITCFLVDLIEDLEGTDSLPQDTAQRLVEQLKMLPPKELEKKEELKNNLDLLTCLASLDYWSVNHLIQLQKQSHNDYSLRDADNKIDYLKRYYFIKGGPAYQVSEGWKELFVALKSKKVLTPNCKNIEEAHVS